MEPIVCIYQGKGKNIFSTQDPEKIILEFKDDLTAFNAQKKGSFKGKGNLGLGISDLLFARLKIAGVPTHHLQTLSETRWLVQKVEMIPLEFVVRNTLAGSTAKKFRIKDGTPLAAPLFELYYKNDGLNDPFCSTEQAIALGFVKSEILSEALIQAKKVNEVLKSIFLKAQLDLIDFKIEFGVGPKGVVLADEISPDSCRLWDLKTGQRLDKDVFRLDLGDVGQAYLEVFNRLKGVLG